MITVGRRGFSMVEAALGIAILSACCLGLIVVISNTTIGNVRLDVSTTSIMLARGVVAEVTARDFNSIANVASTAFPGDFNRYSYSVTVSYVTSDDPDTNVAGPSNLKKVDVSVTNTYLAGAIHIYELKVRL